MSDDADLVAEDVLALLYALLRNAADAVPVGPAPDDGRVEWWEQHARSEEMAEQVWRRFHEWLITTEAHPVYAMAVGDAAEMRRAKARECWERAAVAREQQEWR